MQPVFLGRRSPWPLAGHLRGEVSEGPDCLRWAGRVASGGDLETAWRAAGILHAALRRAGDTGRGRRRVLAAAWERVASLDPSALGPLRGADLHLMLVARDEEGFAISAVGLGGLFALESDGVAKPLLSGRHPMMGRPGVPDERPGALTVEQGPPWLVAVAWGSATIDGEPAGRVLSRCGVDPTGGG